MEMQATAWWQHGVIYESIHARFKTAMATALAI